MLCALVGLAAIIATASAVPAIHYSADATVQKSKWDKYKADFQKAYATEDEETLRFGLFVKSLKTIDQRNAHAARAGHNTEHGLTKFSDLSQEEFEAQYLTYRPEPGAPSVHLRTANHGRVLNHTMRSDVSMTTQSYRDWTGTYTTAVKDQGPCGSCWAFSAVEQIESDYLRVKTSGYPAYTLSAGQVTSCTGGGMACTGGFPTAAYYYVGGMNGIVLESTAPYSLTGPPIAPSACTIPSNTASWKVQINSFTQFSTEAAMGSYVLNTGPISVCFDGSTLNTYAGGNLACFGAAANHCAQAVGLATYPHTFTVGGGDQWKIRNQFGTGFGYAGYLYLSYGSNACKITEYATYVGIYNYQ